MGRNKYETIQDIMTEPTKAEIIKQMFLNPGITATDLKDELKLTPATISNHISLLEEYELVKIEFDNKSGRGIKKRLIPSYKGFFKSLAEYNNVEFPDDVYDNIDKLIFHNSLRNSIKAELKKVPKNKPLNVNFLMLSIMMKINSGEFKRIIDRDRKLKQILNKGLGLIFRGWVEYKLGNMNKREDKKPL